MGWKERAGESGRHGKISWVTAKEISTGHARALRPHAGLDQVHPRPATMSDQARESGNPVTTLHLYGAPDGMELHASCRKDDDLYHKEARRRSMGEPIVARLPRLPS